MSTVAEKITFPQMTRDSRPKSLLANLARPFGPGAERNWDGRRGSKISSTRWLIYSDRSFLLVPKKRKFDPFGQSLRGKLRRLVTRSDGLNNFGSQERQPSQSPDVIREDPFTLSYHCNRFHSTREQIVRP